MTLLCAKILVMAKKLQDPFASAALQVVTKRLDDRDERDDCVALASIATALEKRYSVDELYWITMEAAELKHTGFHRSQAAGEDARGGCSMRGAHGAAQAAPNEA